MSANSEDEALESGIECVMAAVAVSGKKVATLTAGDRLQWWIGFVTATLRAAQGSIGDTAFRALRRSLVDEEDAGEAALAVLRRLHAAGALELMSVTGAVADPTRRTKNWPAAGSD